MEIGNTGLFNHITVQIRRANCAWKVMAWRFNNYDPFNFRYFLEWDDALEYANDLLKGYKWRL